MGSNLEFIINAIIKVSKTDRMEGLEGGEVITIKGTKTGFLKNEEIQILIRRCLSDPNNAAFVTATINEKSESEDILKEIVYDILERTEMLDNKLSMKLDIVFNNKKLRFEGGRLIIG
jgi:hypothetical protein